MKRNLLFAMLFIVSALNVSAQTASAVGEGTFYLYNVGTGKAIIGAKDSGTKAAVAEYGGIPVTLSASGGGYTLSTSPLYNNLYIGYDGYVDQGSTVWTFTPVEGETNVYKLSRSNGDYLYAESTFGNDGAAVTVLGADPGNEYGYWKLVTASDLKATFANATESNPVDATFMIVNPQFSRAISKGYGWTMVADNQNLGDGRDVNYIAESWRSAFTLSQTISVPNGKYRLRAQACVHEYTVTGNDFPVVYLNDATTSFKKHTGSEDGMSGFSDTYLTGAYFTDWTDIVTVTTGQITIGVRGTRTDTWCTWDNFQLEACGPITDLSTYAEALTSAVNEANSYADMIPYAGYYALQAVVEANNGTYDTVEEYETAIGNINDAIHTYATPEMIAAYAQYKAVMDCCDALTVIGVIPEDQELRDEKIKDLNNYGLTEMVGIILNQTTDHNKVLEQIPRMKLVLLDFIDGLTPADPDNEPFDITFILQNPEVNGFDGWEQSRPLGGNGPLLGNTAMEYWAGNMSNRAEASFDYYQILSGLPRGTYRVSAEMYNSLNDEGGDYTVFSPTSGVYGQANNTEYTLVDVEGTTLTPYTTADVTTTDGTLRVGVKNFVTPMAARWFVADNFKLFYTGSVDIQAYIDAYSEALQNARTTAASNEKMANWVLTELNTTISNNDEDHVDMNSQSELEAATTALIEANTLGQTSIHSYQVIAQGFVPDDQLDGWVCENDQTFHINTWSTEGGPNLAGETRDSYDGTGMVTPFIENWTGNGGLLGAGKVYYRLEGLEPGEVYRVEALVRSYNEASADAPNGPNFYVLDDVADLTEVGTTFTYNDMSGIYGTQVAAATIGADGVLELGVIISEDRNYNWVAFKNIKIGSFEDALAAAIAAAEELDGAVAPGYYDNNIQALIDGCSGNNYPTTADEFVGAIAALEQAVADADPAKESYKGYLKLKPYADALVAVDNDNAGENSTFAREIADAENAINTLTTVEENDAANAALREAMDTYATLANPQGDGAKFDLTYMLTNPDVTPFWNGEPGDASSGTWGIVPDGWSSDQEDGNKQVMTNADVVNGDKTIFYEYWSDPAKANNIFNLYTTVENLPSGTFNMSCYAFALDQLTGTNAAGVYFYANDTQGSQVTSNILEEASIEFVNQSIQDVKIGLKPTNGNTYNWMGIGYVKLYKVPAKAFIIDEDDDDYDYTQDGAGDVIIRNRSIKEGYNTLVLPFSMTQAEVEQVFGQGAKISVVASYDVDKELLRFTAQDGVVANRPCLLDATQPNDGSDILIEGRTLVPASSLYPTYEAPNVVMTGTYESKTYVPENSWFMQHGKLVYAPDETSCWVNLGRAYITLGDGSHPVKALTVSFEDGATGIAIIENGEMNILTGKIYDLSGREVQNPTRGIYIINGKKVMIK